MHIKIVIIYNYLCHYLKTKTLFILIVVRCGAYLLNFHLFIHDCLCSSGNYVMLRFFFSVILGIIFEYQKHVFTQVWQVLVGSNFKLCVFIWMNSFACLQLCLCEHKQKRTESAILFSWSKAGVNNILSSCSYAYGPCSI